MPMDEAETKKNEGNKAWQRGDIREAIRCFSQAIEFAQNDPSNVNLCIYYSNRSAAYMKLGETQSALLDAEKCTTLDSTWAKGWGRKGAALLALSKYDDALVAYTTAMTLEPENDDYKKGYLRCQERSSSSSDRSHSGSNSSNMTKVVKYVRANKFLSVLFIVRSFLIFNSILFLLPLTSRNWRYSKAMLMHVAISFMLIYQKYRGSRFSMALAQELITNPQLLLAAQGLLFYVQRPYIIALFIVLIPALIQWLCYLSFLLQFCGLRVIFGALDSVMEKVAAPAFAIKDWRTAPMSVKWVTADERAAGLVAQFQVTFGILLIAEVLLPRRNIIMLVLYWQLLRMGVTMETAGKMRGGKEGNLTHEFKNADKKITALLTHPKCPRALLNGYNKVTYYMSQSVKVSTSSQPTTPRCSLM